MGYTNDEEELRPSTPDAEETLPLYSETQFAHTSPLQPPDPKATPDEVRDFLVLAMQSRGLGLDHSRRVAARWTLGTGRELRAYPVAMYRDIFGPEDGWVVYKEVRVLFYKQENEKAIGRWVWFLCLAIAILVFAASITILCNDASDVWQAVAWFGIFFGIIGIPGFAALSTGPSDPESRAEQELQAEWYKASRAQTLTN